MGAPLQEAVGYVMSMLFQWFATTALLPNDAMGSSLEQLKTDVRHSLKTASCEQ